MHDTSVRDECRSHDRRLMRVPGNRQPMSST
jgi:hypothetical protein